MELLQKKFATPVAGPQSNDNLKLASHEVQNLKFQLNDVATMLAGGASPFQVIATQGGQISQILGDKGVKGAVTGVGAAIASLATPVNLALLGIVAAGYAADAAYSAWFETGDDVNKQLDTQQRLLKTITDAYDEATGAATRWGTASKSAIVVEVGQALADARKQLAELSKDFAGDVGPVRIRGLGEVNRPEFAAFADPINEFIASIRTGTPDVDRLVDSIGRIGEASPEVAKVAGELLAMIRNADDAGNSMSAAAGGVAKLEAELALISGTATEAQKELLGVSSAAKEIEAATKTLDRLRRDASRVGDPRTQFVGGFTDDLGKGVGDDQRRQIEAEANALYERQQAFAAGEKAAAEATRERQRLEREWQRDAERVWQSTRTEAEKYAAELERLNELLQRGAIDQETYGRAAAKAAKDLAEARKAATIESLTNSTDPLAGVQLATFRYFDSLGTEAERTADLIAGTFGSLEDAFAAFATSGKIDFNSLVDDMIAGLARYAARQAMLGLVGLGQQALGGVFGGGATGGVAAGFAGSGPLYADGGFTGNGGKHEPAGIVHRGEFVFSKEATSRMGVSTLEAMHETAMRGYADGGFVGRQAAQLATYASDGGRSAGPPAPLNVVINNNAPGVEASAQRTSDGGVQIDIRKMVRGEMQSAFEDGAFDRVGARRFGWRRVMS